MFGTIASSTCRLSVSPLLIIIAADRFVGEGADRLANPRRQQSSDSRSRLVGENHHEV